MINFSNSPRGNVKGIRPMKDDTRTPLYLIFGGDLSGSMTEETKVLDEKGNAVYIPKIEQLNQGFRMTQKSLLRFMKENTRFQIRYQFIELNTYCKPLFPTFELINDPSYNLGEVTFQAGGTTHIHAFFNTTLGFLSHKHLGNYNRAVNIILLSDGVPTDVDGFALSEKEWMKEVDDFKSYLDEHDLARSVELYFIAVGNEAESFGRYFAGEDHFFRVEDSESIADKLDFVTRQSLTNSTTVSSHTDDEDDGESDGDDEILDDEDAARRQLMGQLAQAFDSDEDEGEEEFDEDEEDLDEEYEDEEDSDEEFGGDPSDTDSVGEDSTSIDEDDLSGDGDDDMSSDDSTDDMDDDSDDDGESEEGADGNGEDDESDDDGEGDSDDINDILNF